MLPVVPPAPPRRGNRATRALGRSVLALAGWRVAGRIPDQRKLVVIAAPHTSNWDFVLGIAAVFALGLEAHWIGKHTLFRGPFGPLMRWLGGIPVDRSRRNTLVEQTAASFRGRSQLWLGIAPEGTRRKVSRWKSGFWHIARGAGAPIALGYFDYGRKEVGIGPLIDPGPDYEADLETVLAFYRGVVPRHPERF